MGLMIIFYSICFVLGFLCAVGTFAGSASDGPGDAGEPTGTEKAPERQSASHAVGIGVAAFLSGAGSFGMLAHAFLQLPPSIEITVSLIAAALMGGGVHRIVRSFSEERM